MSRQLLLGLGTGHCGLELLAEILNRQSHARVTYQQPPLLPWTMSPRAPGIRERLERFLRTRGERMVGDVASFYLPYVRDALAFDSRLKVVCLQRPYEEILTGFLHALRRNSRNPINHWTRELPPGWEYDPNWSRTFPQFDTQDIREGIRRYWNLYVEQAAELSRTYPDNVRIFDTDLLTHEAGVREVLDFCGIPRPDQVVVTGKRPNLPPAPQPSIPVHPYPNPMDPRRCVILVPFTGFIHQECEQSLKELERRGYPVRRVAGYAAIDQGRNQMATDALLEGFEETLWIDSDVGFHPDDVEKLRSHGLPLVCGIYPQKGKLALACHVLPGTPSMTFGKGGGLYELLYAGTGFLLIRRQVYLAVQHQLQLPMCNERFGHPMIPFFYPLIRPVEDAHWYLAEDYAFCHRARQCGFPVWADTTIRLWHVGNYRYGWEDAGIERQRIGSFTLNFSEQTPTLAGGNPSQATGISQLQEQYPWPLQQPVVPPPPHRDWFSPNTQQVLEKTVPRDARVIVEVGSFLGRSTRFLSEHAPQATIIAIDHWLGTPSMEQDPELVEFLPRLYDSFLSECWALKDRTIPLRADSVQGLRKVAAAGIEPDVVFIDADHRYDSVVADLTTTLDLFPGVRIAGDDWNWPDVARAVRDVTGNRGISYEEHGTAWRILPHSRPPQTKTGAGNSVHKPHPLLDVGRALQHSMPTSLPSAESGVAPESQKESF